MLTRTLMKFALYLLNNRAASIVEPLSETGSGRAGLTLFCHHLLVTFANQDFSFMLQYHHGTSRNADDRNVTYRVILLLPCSLFVLLSYIHKYFGVWGRAPT